MMPRVSVVIPCFNHYEMTNLLLWSLYQKEYENIDYVLVVDDASTDEVVDEGLKWWQSNGMLPFFWTRNTVNQGFLRTANTGMKMVTGFDDANPDDIIILISNDVQVNGKFIDEIKTLIEQDKTTLVGGRILDYDTGWNKFDQQLFPYLEGWLLATTVENWTKLGYFDERYSICDFEDVDISTSALSLGMRLAPLEGNSLHHVGAQTIGYNPKRLEQTQKNREEFKNKWIK
jgi:GT2 family glycosyltransferase